MDKPLLEYLDQNLHHLHLDWWTCVQNFLHKNEGSIRTTEKILSTTSTWVNDIALQKAANNNYTFSNSQVEIFNQTWLYLKVTFLSEITDPSGAFITDQFWHTTKPADTTIEWPYQPPPSTNSLINWQLILTVLFHKQTWQTSPQPTLHQPWSWTMDHRCQIHPTPSQLLVPSFY